jgi:alkylation response protein AidB-like acyl-CoA dehydrogenase
MVGAFTPNGRTDGDGGLLRYASGRALVKLRLEQDLEDLRDSLDRQAANTVAPLAGQVDRDQAFSPELWSAIRDLGLTRLPFSENYGGDGGTVRAYAVATCEVARHCAVGALYPGTTIQVAMTVLAHGTPGQVERFVRPLVAGDNIAAWAFTEPATGSDPRQITTKAVPDGDGWRLSGSKQFISFAGQASVALVFARTSETALGAFLVDTSAPGWSTGSPSEVLSMGGTEARPVALDEVAVAGDRMIGTVDAGFEVMVAGEAFGKVRAAAICVGIARRAIEEAAAYATSRGHRGTAIGRRFPTLQALLGSATSGVLAAEALVLACADLLDGGQAIPAEAASARLVAGRAAREAANAAMHVCGAYGLTRDLIVERLYREAIFFDVAQGVSEIQQIIVARELLAAVSRNGVTS